MVSEIEAIIDDFRKGLTFDGRKRVFEDGKKLQSEYIIEDFDPEPYTIDKLIEPIVKKLGLEKTTQKRFKGIRGDIRKVDCVLTTRTGMKILVEVKPVNTNLFEKSSHGAFSQIAGVFRLAEVQEKYAFGIATDGIKWVFIDKDSKLTHQLNVIDQFKQIVDIIKGKIKVSHKIIEEEISSKFYDWYNALLHGGKYKDHNNKTKTISAEDCLIENILTVKDIDDREQIAQVIMDRLIFIKFLQSKGIITQDILEYLLNLKEHILNIKLQQLFFQVLNTSVKERVDVDPKFSNIPYLNGSLFIRTEAEKNNLNYQIRAEILREVIKFLDSFKFIHSEKGEDKLVLDPEILGYIFERAMNVTDRKGTGSYYTPKTITKYITEATINPVIIKKVNSLLKEKGYKELELISKVEEIFKLSDTTLNEIYKKIILNFKICDNACGSGAFLLAASNIVLQFYLQIKEKLGMMTSEAGLRRLVLVNNIYGVDLNPNAIEIAKLRLWLWLVDAYVPHKIIPLPNIDYNLRVGNSLIGFIEVSNIIEQEEIKSDSILGDFFDNKKQLNLWFSRRKQKIVEYKSTEGNKTRNLKTEIERIDKQINRFLNRILYVNLFQKKETISYEEFLKLKPFHWEFEFNNVFNNNSNLETGFDVIIGNPPYFKVKEDNIINKTPEYKEIKCRMMNVSAVFINRTLKLVHSESYIGMIVPKMLAFTDSWKKIRGKMLQESTLERVIDCGKAFKGVLLEQVIFILDMHSMLEHHKIIIGKLIENTINETVQIEQKLCLEENSIYLESNPQAYEIKKIMEQSMIRLGDISEIKLGLGIQGQKDVFIEQYKEGFHKVLRGVDIQRYYIRGAKYYNPKDTRIAPYFSTINQFKEKHIVVQRIVAHIKDHIKLTATLDEEGLFSFNTVTNIFITDNSFDIKFILGLLNSNIIQYYTYKFIYNNAIRSMDFYRVYAERIPVPKVSLEDQQKIVKIVDKLLEVSESLSKPGNLEEKQKLFNLEREMNDLFYLLYGLSHENKGIVEKSLA